MNEQNANSPKVAAEVVNDALLVQIKEAITSAKCRHQNLIRDAEDARLKADVVQEYRYELEDLRDKLTSLGKT